MADLAIYYEHPQWFLPLFSALDRRGVDYVALNLQTHSFDPAEPGLPAPVVFNRLAMSAFLRQDEHAIFYTMALMAHFEQRGARVMNGSAALAIDTSKARQLSLFRSLGLDVPATRVVHRFADVAAAATQLRFPIMVKGDIGGSGAGMARYDSLEELAAYADEQGTPAGLNGVTLVQEYVPAEGGRVIRCETLGGRFLYAIALDGAGSTFDLCPADVCQADRAGSGKPTITISAFEPSAQIVRAVEAAAQAAHLDVGGVEYMVDERDGTPRFYDLNALSNFVANPHAVLGYDPHEKLVDLLEREIARAHRLAA
jgi:hypothetical protein